MMTRRIGRTHAQTTNVTGRQSLLEFRLSVNPILRISDFQDNLDFPSVSASSARSDGFKDYIASGEIIQLFKKKNEKKKNNNCASFTRKRWKRTQDEE